MGGSPCAPPAAERVNTTSETGLGAAPQITVRRALP
jgi:hypothetical protein